MKRSNRKTAFILGTILLIIILICALFAFESSKANSGIDTFSDALWYSLVTLTTVGYGDITPVTSGGRIIGVIFMLCSLGILSLILTSVISWFNKGLPLWRLKRNADLEWNIFIGETIETESFSANMIKEAEGNALFIFLKDSPESDLHYEQESGALIFHAQMPLSKLLSYKKDLRNANVFYLNDDLWRNYTEAMEGAGLYGAKFYAMTEVKSSFSTNGLSVFNKYDEIARNYWNEHPIKSQNEKIIISGFGYLGEAILNRALLTNIISPEQSISYICAGDIKDYVSYHFRLFEAGPHDSSDTADTGITYNLIQEPSDKVSAYDSLWKIPSEIINQANRIILCADDAKENMLTLQKLNLGYASTAEVYLFSPEGIEIQGAESFGRYSDIFSKQAVLKHKRIALAVRLNNSYRELSGGNAPTWDELSEFHKQSNIASADHMLVKCQILLGNDRLKELRKSGLEAIRKEAASVYSELKNDPIKLELFRRIEHDRWMRFHLLNNWGYAPVRDNRKHLHNLCISYEKLSPEDQRKDDSAWEILERI